MSGAADLHTLKADKTALLEALKAAGARINGNMAHIGCPWHGEDKTGSLSVSNNEGAWLWHCHVCDCGGSLIDVVARAEKLENDAAVKRTVELYGRGPGTEDRHGQCASRPGFCTSTRQTNDLDAIRVNLPFDGQTAPQRRGRPLAGPAVDHWPEIEGRRMQRVKAGHGREKWDNSTW